MPAAAIQRNRRYVREARIQGYIHTSYVQRRRTATYSAVIAVIFFSTALLGVERPMPRPMHTSILTGKGWLDEVLHGHPDRCHRELGMSALQFSLLWAELAANGELADSRFITSQEQLAIFVYWMVHGSSQRELQERFQRSGDTISRRVSSLITNSSIDCAQQIS